MCLTFFLEVIFPEEKNDLVEGEEIVPNDQIYWRILSGYQAEQFTFLTKITILFTIFYSILFYSILFYSTYTLRYVALGCSIF